MEEEEKRKLEEKVKREKEEEERLGEEEKVWLDLRIVRKPAVGAGRKVQKKVEAVEVEVEVEAPKAATARRESTGVKVEDLTEVEGDDELESVSGSEDSSSVVIDVAKDADMWGTTVIGSDG